MGLIRTRSLIDLCTHAARQPGENQTWRGRENIHLRFVQLSHARKHYPPCVRVRRRASMCVRDRTIRKCFKSARKSFEGRKKANKCNLHSNLFTKQPYKPSNDKINDGVRPLVKHSLDSDSSD